jgi:hypothetical protein
MACKLPMDNENFENFNRTELICQLAHSKPLNPIPPRNGSAAFAGDLSPHSDYVHYFHTLDWNGSSSPTE